MSRSASATLNYQLTNYAVGHMNDLRDVNSIVERLCPTVQVPGTTGQYKKFDEKNSFQLYNTSRAMGGDPKRLEFGASDGTYACKPHALEVTIDKEERRQVGEENAVGLQLLDQGKVKALINVTALSRTKRIVTDTVLPLLTPVPDYGNWDNPEVDPIDQLDKQIDDIMKECGSTDNVKIDMDVSAWRWLRSHPKVKARCTGVQVNGITLGQFNGLTFMPVDTKVSSIVYNEAALGATLSKKRVLAGVVLIYYSIPSPTLYDPSPFKCFTAGQGNQVMGVRSYQAPNGFYEGHIIDWSETIEQTSTLGIRRLNITAPAGQ